MKKQILLIIYSLFFISFLGRAGDKAIQIIDEGSFSMEVNGVAENTQSTNATSATYSDFQISKRVPMSPNASSLSIFGAIPIGHYTGIPNVTIPIYEIDFDGKKIPIQLAYHASGIKVAQESSDVGLGWALNAGGSIVKEVRGWDDFTDGLPKGYYFDTNFPHWDADNEIDSIYLSNDNDSYIAYGRNQEDPQPDLFHFNFMGFSGTMFFDKINKNGNSSSKAKAFIRKGEAYLDATYQLSASGGTWEIFDGEGFKYCFSTHETSKMYSRNESDYLSAISRTSISERKIQPNVVTAWYVDSIVSPSKKVMTFTYGFENIYSPISVSEDLSYQLATPDVNNITDVANPFKAEYAYYNYSYAITQQAKLKSITFPGGYLSLNYSDRLDLESADDNATPKKLSSLVIYDNNKNKIKEIDLEHSYLGSTSSPLNCRLILDVVKISSQNKSERYKLAYNRNSLPDKQSALCDYWGYNNNATKVSNTNGGSQSFKLSPPLYAMWTNKDDGVISGRFIYGMDRSPDPARMQYGILQSIEYPTGGRSVFEYELNDFSNTFTKDAMVSVASLYDEPSEPYDNQYISAEVTIATNTGGQLRVIYNNSGTKSSNAKFFVEKKSSTNQYVYYKSYTTKASASSSTSENYDLILPTGVYRLRLDSTNNVITGSFTTNLFIAKSDTVTKGGGLRLKSITNYNSDLQLISKKAYNYRKGEKTSGLLMSVPQFHSYWVLGGERHYIMETAVFSKIFNALYINGSSSPYTSFGNSAQGNCLGYSYVEEKDISGQNGSSSNGRTVYKFDNKEDSLYMVVNMLTKGYNAIPYLNNGSPLETCYYNKDNKIVQKKSFSYQRSVENSIKGLYVFKIPMSDINISVKFYDIVSERWRLSSQIDSSFFDNRDTPFVVTSYYGYNKTNFLKNYEQIKDSRGDTSSKSIKFASDSNASIYQGMINSHMVNLPTEIINDKAGAIVSAKKIEYQYTQKLYLPTSAYSFASTSPIQGDNYINFYQKENDFKYYTDGALREVIDKAGISTTYLWAYNRIYPVVEINNADYSQINNVLGEAYIATLATGSPSVEDLGLLRTNLKQTLPNALVTTYTYKPLVGMLTSTDPRGVTTYYEYDDFNRLKRTYIIENNQEKTIRSYDYHYQNQ